MNNETKTKFESNIWKLEKQKLQTTASSAGYIFNIIFRKFQFEKQACTSKWQQMHFKNSNTSCTSTKNIEKTIKVFEQTWNKYGFSWMTALLMAIPINSPFSVKAKDKCYAVKVSNKLKDKTYNFNYVSLKLRIYMSENLKSSFSCF